MLTFWTFEQVEHELLWHIARGCSRERAIGTLTEPPRLTETAKLVRDELSTSPDFTPKVLAVPLTLASYNSKSLRLISAIAGSFKDLNRTWSMNSPGSVTWYLST